MTENYLQHLIREKERKKNWANELKPVCSSFTFAIFLFCLSHRNYRNEPGSLIQISMLDLPRERLIRRVVKTTMDDASKLRTLISI